MPQLSLQQYSPGPQNVCPHRSPTHSACGHGAPFGTQIPPPQTSQQWVPSTQRTAAHPLDPRTGSQVPPQAEQQT